MPDSHNLCPEREEVSVMIDSKSVVRQGDLVCYLVHSSGRKLCYSHRVGLAGPVLKVAWIGIV